MKRRGSVLSKTVGLLVILGIMGMLASAMLLSSGSATASASRSNARSRERQAYQQLETHNPVASSPLQETARYTYYPENIAKQTQSDSVSTFGLDMDTASYANLRRFLNAGHLPPPDAVRVEEMLNYFPPLKEEQQSKFLGESPFRVDYKLAPCPWNENNLLLWLSVEAQALDYQDGPPANLVFLVDVSGSMQSPERLPLVQSALNLLTDRLRAQDRISIVTYAGSVRVALEPTPVEKKWAIQKAIDDLSAGGSTAGGAALQLAYEQAEKAFIPNGINRILLCTDGDFNVGVSDVESLTRMVSRYRSSGITLSVLGFGTDNLNDAMMVAIADSGNGNYGYIDNLSEAQKILGEEMKSTLVTIAKDAKAQIEFNPAIVKEYRQIGYEKRQLRREDFSNDKIDAGDIGAGKRVTVLYELRTTGQKDDPEGLRYGNDKNVSVERSAQETSDEIAYLKLRWKAPSERESRLVEIPLKKDTVYSTFEQAPASLRFSAAVAAFGQKLRGMSELDATAWKEIAVWAEKSKGSDPGGYRAELVRLVGLAGALAGSR